MNKSQVRKYYLEEAEKYFEFPDLPNFRQYRIKRRDGSFLKIKRRIRDYAAFKKNLIRLEKLGLLDIGDIKDVYYSVACWLNPTQLSGSKRKRGFMDVMMKTDLPSDLDSDVSLEGLEECRQNTVKLIEWLDKQKIKIKYVSFSNKKGFHVICEEQPLEDKSSSKLKENRKIFISQLPNEIKETIDIKVTEDPLRIIKLPGSLNIQTGLIATKLTKLQILQPITELIKNHIPSFGRKERPLRRETVNDSTPSQEDQKNERRGPSSFVRHYVRNNIKGTKDRYILILKYQWPKKKVEEILKKLMQQYKLSDFYLFKEEENTWAINLTALQRRQHEKIMNKSQALNHLEHAKFKHTRFPITKKIGKDKTEGQIPKYIKTIKSSFNPPISKGHSILLNKFKIKVTGTVGTDKITRTITRVEIT